VFSFMKREPGFYRQVAVLSAPIVLQNLITSTLGMADTFMVGLLGELPMAAVTLANIPIFVVQLFIFGVQSGSSVLFSQYWGKKDTESISRVLGVGVWIVLAFTCTFAAVLLLWPVEFLSFFGNDPEKVPAQALSVGVGTVFDSKEVLVLINGHNKAKALAATVEGAVSQKWTCSALQYHNGAIIACDEAACDELTVGAYKYFLDIERGERL